MGRMVSIQIDTDDMIDQLVNRVGYWTDDSDVIDLFEQYYEHMVEGGCYDGCEFDVMSIVDNDYVNNTSVVTRKEFDKAREEYIQESMDSDGFSDEDRPKAEDYEDKEDFEEELKTFEEEKAEALEQYEEETPTWEDVESSRDIPDFLSIDYIEAMTDSLMLISY